MSPELTSYEERMLKTIEVVKSNFAAVRAGRANAGVLDRITVEYYGAPTPLNQVANIGSPDPRTLTIQPYDMSLLKAIEKAIQTSDLGINPQNDGRVIRLSFPQLTEERRKDLTKQVRKYGEEGHQKENQKVRAHRGRPEEAGKGAPGCDGQAVQGHRRSDRQEGKGAYGGVSPLRTGGGEEWMRL